MISFFISFKFSDTLSLDKFIFDKSSIFKLNILFTSSILIPLPESVIVIINLHISYLIIELISKLIYPSLVFFIEFSITEYTACLSLIESPYKYSGILLLIEYSNFTFSFKLFFFK